MRWEHTHPPGCISSCIVMLCSRRRTMTRRILVWDSFGQSLETNGGKWSASQEKSNINTWRAPTTVIPQSLQYLILNFSRPGEEIERIKPTSSREYHGFFLQVEIEDLQHKTPYVTRGDMISTFMRMLGPTYRFYAPRPHPREQFCSRLSAKPQR